MKGFVFDFDNTLFNADEFSHHIRTLAADTYGSKSAELFIEYDKARNVIEGHIDVRRAVTKFAERHSLDPEEVYSTVFTPDDIPQFLFPGAIDLLKRLKEIGVPLLCTAGDSQYQPAKVRACNLYDVLGEENVIITQRKISKLPDFIRNIGDKGITVSAFIDDKLRVLYEVHAVAPQIHCVQMHYGKHAHNKELLTFPYSQVESIAELSAILIPEDGEAVNDIRNKESRV